VGHLTELFPPEVAVEPHNNDLLVILVGRLGAEFSEIREELRLVDGNHLQGDNSTPESCDVCRLRLLFELEALRVGKA